MWHLCIRSHDEVGLVVRAAAGLLPRSPPPFHREHRQHDGLRGTHRRSAGRICRPEEIGTKQL